MKLISSSFILLSLFSLNISCAAPTTTQVGTTLGSASPTITQPTTTQTPTPIPTSTPTPIPTPTPTPIPTPTPVPKPILKPLTDLLRSEAFYKTTWSLAINYSDPAYTPKRHEQVALEVKGGLTDSLANDDEKKLHDKCRANAVTYLEKLFLVGDEIPRFLYGDKSGPFRIGEYKDKQVLMLSSVGIDVTYNTLRLDGKARAKNAITSYIIPELDDLYNNFKDHIDIEYFAIALTHGARDFSSDSVLAQKEEMVALVSDRNTIEAFINGEITDSEFISSSAAFQSDDKSSFDVRRIDLSAP